MSAARATRGEHPVNLPVPLRNPAPNSIERLLSGEILLDAKAKDGKRLVIRFPSRDLDLDTFPKILHDDLHDHGVPTSDKIPHSEKAAILESSIFRVSNGESVILVAEVDGRVAGKINLDEVGESATLYEQAASILGRDVRRERIWAINIRVMKPYRGNGVGEALMRTILKTAKELGIEIVYGRVDPENRAALEMDKKLGFKEVVLPYIHGEEIPDPFKTLYNVLV